MSTSTSMMPRQAAPIDRTPTGAANFSNRAGVDASGFWDVLGGVARAAAPIALPALAGLI